MEQNADLASLITQREALKDQLKFFDEFLNNYENAPNFRQLQLRLNQIVGAFQEFNKINDEIFKLDVSNVNVNARFTILDDYLKAIEKAQNFFDKEKHSDGAVIIAPFSDPMDTSTTGSISGDQSLLANQSIASQVHRTPAGNPTTQSFPYKPRPNFERFNGDSLQWLTFKDSFLSWQTRISQEDVDRFNDLKSCLTGDALNKIDHFHSGNQTYQEAWNLLVKTYENPIFLTAHYINAMLTLPKVNTSNYKEIERLADKVQAYVAALKTLNVILSPEMVTGILEKSLSDDLLSEWRKEWQKSTTYPQYHKMVEFLYHTATYFSQINANKRPSKGNNNNPSKRDHQNQKTTARALVTAGRKCPLCPDKDHPLFACLNFNAKSVHERWKIVKNVRVCWNCLLWHRKGDCKMKSTCKKCNQPHNTRLHRERTSTNEETAKET